MKSSNCRYAISFEGVDVESAALLRKSVGYVRRIDLVEKPIADSACMFDSAPRPSEMWLSRTMSPKVVPTMRDKVALRVSWKVCVVVNFRVLARVVERKRIAKAAKGGCWLPSNISR
jgi:hypothetical protein